MSVVFVVAPAVVASWPVLCAAIAGAAGALGYRSLKQAAEVEDVGPIDTRTQVSLEAGEVVAESMQRESEFVVAKGDVTATFRRAADGRCLVHVAAENKSEAELTAVGRELVGRVTQQYAYNKVVTELKRQGFSVTDEEVTADQAIRIRVSKYV